MDKIEDGLLALAMGPRPPADAREVMRLSLADWAACACAGAAEPAARRIADLVRQEAGRPEATLIGGGRVPARAAALANGTASHALDYDDTHFAHIGHPSVAVLPAALAMAERRGATLEACLDAALIGAEGSVRAGIWLGRGHYQAGFHQTATAGSIGATLAAARLLGLDAERTAHALGLAATRGSGLKSQFGTDGKPYNAGIAASNGVEVALLAEAGMTSRPDGLSCAQGFGPTHHGAADMRALDGLGERWLFEEVTLKFHACCHGLHAAIDALGALHPELAGQEVARVKIETHPRWMSVCNIPAPRTGLEAKFSYALTAAMVLDGRDTAALESFSDGAAYDADLVALRGRVDVVANPLLKETEAKVDVSLADGRILRSTADTARHLSLGERQIRLESKIRALLGERDGMALESAISSGELSTLVDFLHRRS